MLAIIGCGNPDRQDDGFGNVVVARLKALAAQKPWSGVVLLDAGVDGASVIAAARGASALIVVDANKSGWAPGTVYKPPRKEVAHAFETGFCLHDFRWDKLLHAGRRLLGAEFPDDIVVLIVEEEKFGPAVGLTPSVATAVELVVALIVSRIESACDIAHIGEIRTQPPGGRPWTS